MIILGEGDPNWVHPPVGKYFIGLGILLFGDNSFGWRIMAVIFGSLSIFLIYYIALEIFQKISSALIAGFLLLIDPLHFVHTRIAMLDAFLLPFLLLSFYGMLRHFRYSKTGDQVSMFYSHWLLISALSIGIALSVKWTATLGILGIIMIYLLFTFRIRRREFSIRELKALVKHSLFTCFLFIIIPLTVFFFSFSIFFLYGTSFEEWYRTQLAIIEFQASIQSVHPYQSRAWTWILNLKPMLYYLSESGNAIIKAEGNNISWWFGLISLPYLSYIAIKGRRIATFILIGIGTQYLPWFISPRTTYLFYFFPTVPFICLASTFILTILLNQKHTILGRIFVILYLFGVAFTFIYAIPTYLGIPSTFWQDLL